MPRKYELTDSTRFELFTAGAGLEEVLEHLGLHAIAQTEAWTGAVVGEGRVYITTIGDPKGDREQCRDNDVDMRQFYEIAFQDGTVTKDMQEEEKRLRDELEAKIDLYFGYSVDLDERGSFRASVRNSRDECVFTVLGGDALPEDCTDLVTDGFMRHLRDLDGLRDHLQALGVMPGGAHLLDIDEAERRVDKLIEQHWKRIPVLQFATTAPDAAAIRSEVERRALEGSGVSRRQRDHMGA